jgi:hypothetical protein
VPNDSPDYANTIATPAIDLGAFTVAANNLVTVYNAATPPGTHALKVYIKSTDATYNAQQVTVIDPSDAHVIQQFILPKSTNLVTAVDDVSTPNIRVDVQARVGAASTGRVVAFLSDQAVTVDNDPNTAVPVTLGGVPVTTTAAQTGTQSVAANTAGSMVIPAVAGQRIYLSTLTSTSSAAAVAGWGLTITDSITGVIWQAFPGDRGQHFTFPMPMFSSVGANLTITTSAPGAGITHIIDATWGYGT